MMPRPAFSYCPVCGAGLREQFVHEEGRDRLVCQGCARIHYLNPVVVAGVIPVADGRVWLLRRAIEPRYGFWTFPAGYMELGETVEEAALRETREELNLEVRLLGPARVYSRETAPTVLTVFPGEAISEPSPGVEALTIAAFQPEDVPWGALAFWSTERALEDWVRSVRS